MVKLRGEEVSREDIMTTLTSWRELGRDLETENFRVLLVKVTMKRPLLSLAVWRTQTDSHDVMQSFCNELEQGKMDALFTVTIKEVDLSEVQEAANTLNQSKTDGADNV
jgi:hypothetical protein